MKIWIDADACPVAVKDILFRAARRTNISLVLVANNFINIPPSPFITAVRVGQGFDVADDYIVTHVAPHDLVITADIPLAAQVIAKQGIALNPRGELYTENNIKQRLGLRDMREQLRGAGAQISGPSSYSDKEKMAFANALDRILARAK